MLNYINELVLPLIFRLFGGQKNAKISKWSRNNVKLYYKNNFVKKGLKILKMK